MPKKPKIPHSQLFTGNSISAPFDRDANTMWMVPAGIWAIPLNGDELGGYETFSSWKTVRDWFFLERHAHDVNDAMIAMNLSGPTKEALVEFLKLQSPGKSSGLVFIEVPETAGQTPFLAGFLTSAKSLVRVLNLDV